jgi:choline-glycine betaine transporter
MKARSFFYQHTEVEIFNMKFLANCRWIILIFLLIAGLWFALSQQKARSSSQTGYKHQAIDASTKTKPTREESSATRRQSEAARDRLANVVHRLPSGICVSCFPVDA